MKLINKPHSVIVKEFIKFLEKNNIKRKYVYSIKDFPFEEFEKRSSVSEFLKKCESDLFIDNFNWIKARRKYQVDWEYFNRKWKGKLHSKYTSKKNIIDII